jgi:hypothetical protein
MHNLYNTRFLLALFNDMTCDYYFILVLQQRWAMVITLLSWFYSRSGPWWSRYYLGFTAEMGHSDRVIILVLQQRWTITIDLFLIPSKNGRFHRLNFKKHDLSCWDCIHDYKVQVLAKETLKLVFDVSSINFTALINIAGSYLSHDSITYHTTVNNNRRSCH